ncbi:Uu.00g085890.m01.CDS01 [Anthostomella pinea]|uniref:Uu.00g085890.m01.CDS01 n=1 Tax=Anthostomella pinea TaxID=933095 RepID=A0AAI8VGM6_9PEZI|nr:Uu.00g085890.m01.CDS01 [Anthostomella pinea]
MSDKHFFPETAANTLVPKYLRAFTAANPHLGLIDSERVVYEKRHDRGTVSVISGGGSGHEPGWSGYVGRGALAAAACGDIFASPSTKQITAAIRATPSDEGHILMITNYTGDNLHFGLAAERAKADGTCKNIAVVPLTDDVSLGRSKSAVVGRRGMPGHIIPAKIATAAAARKYSFERCLNLAQAVNAEVVSIGSALDHCHVPGRAKHETLPADVVVVGAGIHNEPGAQRLSPFPPVEDLIAHCLRLLCDPMDTERAFVDFHKDDAVVLLINNYGGVSNLELGALTDEVMVQLGRSWDIKPTRVLSGSFETSLNGPGFSISLCNITNVANKVSAPVEELLDLFDMKTEAVHWPNVSSSEAYKTQTNDTIDEVRGGGPEATFENDIKVEPKLLDTVIRSACKAAIAAEPDLTKWDMIMGDGDCGEAVQGVSEDVIAILDRGENKDGSIMKFLLATTDAVDNMGGSLGAILGILLSAFTSSLQEAVGRSSSQDAASRAPTYAEALARAVETLKKYTGAREGDRTVMDVLIPFAEAFAATDGDLTAAVKVAHDKAEGTRHLKAKFGRASYVAEAQGQAIPDPGAWAFYEWVAGMQRAIEQQAATASS